MRSASKYSKLRRLFLLLVFVFLFSSITVANAAKGLNHISFPKDKNGNFSIYVENPAGNVVVNTPIPRMKYIESEKIGIQPAPKKIMVKPEIESLIKIVQELKLRIQALKDKIDSLKCLRGLETCKNKTLIPSKQLLPL